MLSSSLRRILPVSRPLRQPRSFSTTHSILSSSSSTPPPDLDEGERNIHAKLTERFSPTQLQVQDISGGCGSFYAVTIASDAFKGLSTIKQHRMVTDVLKSEIAGIHGIQIKTLPPQ